MFISSLFIRMFVFPIITHKTLDLENFDRGTRYFLSKGLNIKVEGFNFYKQKSFPSKLHPKIVLNLIFLIKLIILTKKHR